MRSKSVYITLKNIRKSGYTGVPTSIFAKVKASGSLGMHNPNLVKPKFVSSCYISYSTFQFFEKLKKKCKFSIKVNNF